MTRPGWVIARSYANERQDSAIGFLARALGWFAGQGVTVERVMTDNGSAYLSKAFRAALTAAGLKHKRTRRYTPRTNGKAERFIQTSLREWAYARPYATSQRAQRRLGALARALQYRAATRRPGPPSANGSVAPNASCFVRPTGPLLRPDLLSTNDGSGRPGQGSPQATGGSRRAASCVSGMPDSLGVKVPCAT